MSRQTPFAILSRLTASGWTEATDKENLYDNNLQILRFKEHYNITVRVKMGNPKSIPKKRKSFD